MKKTIINVGIIFLATFAMSSCGNQDCTKEIEALKKENEKLKAEVNYLSAKNNGDTLNIEKYFKAFALASKPFDNLPQAIKACGDFRVLTSSSNIKIPIAFLFKSDQLGLLAGNHPYIRFYSSIKPGSTDLYTISAVGVNSKNEDVIDFIDDIKPHIYEFADPCPPCLLETGETHQNSDLYPAGSSSNTFYTFKKQ